MSKHTTHNRLAWIDHELDQLERGGLSRRLRTRLGPQRPELRLGDWQGISFGSNDYLGLAGDARLAEAVAQAVRTEGWGSGASPLLAGHAEAHRRLEAQLAQFEQVEAALVFGSGFAANAGTIAALVGPGDVVFTDRKNHASLLDGCRLSRADVRAWPHGDVERLDALLARSGRYRRRLVVTDGLFSMDGDLAPLVELADAAERHGAMLMVDEAHATGVFGLGGRGAAEALGVELRVDARVGTLSKALGSIGGFVAGSRRLIEWLVHRARPYVFSTAMPAAAAAAALAALDVVHDEPERRTELLRRAEQLRRRLADQGWNVGPSASQIIPLVVGRPERAMTMAEKLYARGFYVPAIRPPTVPEGESCLRVSLSWAHLPEQIDALVETLADLRDQTPPGA
ncbi:MAG: 8-amino-7-oxononanoate synthase [Pirellulales bacterium]|nr:8-amino-7-oxononanoate synthase [Pirellulales bacterium]